MRACNCAIPAMGGSCVGCQNNNQDYRYYPPPATPNPWPGYNPQLGAIPKTPLEDIGKKLDEIIRLLGEKK